MKIRPATPQDIPGIARVHVASWLSSYRGIVPDLYLDQLSVEKHVARHQRIMSEPGKIYFVAESYEQGIVGFLSGGANRTADPHYHGELYALYILAEHHRKGVGQELVRAWVKKLLDEGIGSALVWVLAENLPAISFYTQLGARLIRKGTIELAGTELSELAYGWVSLRDLIDEGSQSFEPIETVAKLMEKFPAPWYVSGGWAIDLFLGRVTRAHGDIEIGIYRCDQQQLFQHLQGWSFEKAAGEPGNPWQPWAPGEDLQLPVHQIRARNPNGQPAAFEFFLNQRTQTHWYSRRHDDVMRPLADVALSSRQGIPYLAPEIQLLFKAKHVRPKDQADFENVLPRLDLDQRKWLAEKLRAHHPAGLWAAALGERGPTAQA